MTALGTRSSFDKTTGAMLKKFYDTWYAPNNAILVIVGDVQPQQALAEVRRFFADIPSKKIPERPDIRLEPIKPETIHLKTDQSYGLIMISFRMPGYDSPDYAASQVLAEVLSNQRSSLFALVPEGKALYTGIQPEHPAESGRGIRRGRISQRGRLPPLWKERSGKSWPRMCRKDFLPTWWRPPNGTN